MGRHARVDDGPDLAGLIETCGPIAPAPRRPADAMCCPECRSTETVRWGSRAHCGCGAEWAVGADLAAQRGRAATRWVYDAWAAGGQLGRLAR